ncbi:hypothetical protein K488DRAFT_71041 [Vararia minispora EC-137]|uniref:Uncharacterized protein n=1 Tax=Vararia minispora EC-137 TaxID=1314806 RepID=A0ACB8QJ92_9AGAM|nr:hypothetical protein K488DRAFT_71041 [Vararia minispora EC-137]
MATAAPPKRPPFAKVDPKTSARMSLFGPTGELPATSLRFRKDRRDWEVRSGGARMDKKGGRRRARQDESATDALAIASDGPERKGRGSRPRSESSEYPTLDPPGTRIQPMAHNPDLRSCKFACRPKPSQIFASCEQEYRLPPVSRNNISHAEGFWQARAVPVEADSPPSLLLTASAFVPERTDRGGAPFTQSSQVVETAPHGGTGPLMRQLRTHILEPSWQGCMNGRLTKGDGTLAESAQPCKAAPFRGFIASAPLKVIGISMFACWPAFGVIAQQTFQNEGDVPWIRRRWDKGLESNEALELMQNSACRHEACQQHSLGVRNSIVLESVQEATKARPSRINSSEP